MQMSRMTGAMMAALMLGSASVKRSEPREPVYSREDLDNHPGANRRRYGGGSRWMPHQGKKEIARRQRQMEAGKLSMNVRPVAEPAPKKRKSRAKAAV